MPAIILLRLRCWLIGSVVFFNYVGPPLASLACAAAPPVRWHDGTLVYDRDDRGNQVPDFSYCGYRGGDEEIPLVPPRVVVTAVEGDDGQRIQAAIDYVASLPCDELGFRGAVLLAPGTFEVAGQLMINRSGVVLRGAGASTRGTTILATGIDRRTLIRILGSANRQIDSESAGHVNASYVPVGATSLRVDDASSLRVGDAVIVHRPSTAAWIEQLRMSAFGVAWKPGTRDVWWDREIVALDHNVLTLDGPITTAIEERFGGATVQRYHWPGRISSIGIEDLRLHSAYSAANPHDEEHAWFGTTIECAEDVWVRRIEFRHFAGGAVAVWENARCVTVEDCTALSPISELAAYRRHTFFTQGGQTLFLRCWSQHGLHDFSVGHCAAGPNAFVNCAASEALGDSGPLESWATGVLYDNVRIDGAGLHLENRWSTPPGAGWSAANCLIWQCQAATMRCFRPPTAQNWTSGVWTRFAGDVTLWGESEFVRPLSIYQAQLEQRLGEGAMTRLGPFLLRPVAATNPSLAEAREFAQRSHAPARRLDAIIRENCAGGAAKNCGIAAAVSAGALTIEQVLSTGAASGDVANEKTSAAADSGQIQVRNGWIVTRGKVKTGGAIKPSWWRGTNRPGEAPSFGPSITRFVPGRVGIGFTDDLQQVTATMKAKGTAVFDYHYGLWYDRRRDDHLMVRRSDGNVAPPFYEQPFARTGVGRAWDGLSRYDLRKPNRWYWNRLQEFARHCNRQGLVLFHHHYFQHNILEAGAHWADSPWRPANNVNEPGFPEPPPYVGDKRIFLAHLFYDVTNVRLRDLHRSYIHQCLDSFADRTNVVHFTSAEFTGPLEFTQFWIDCVAEWEQENGRDVLLGLSTTKDVQDAVLSDPVRSELVDVIDIRYWTYTGEGAIYAPPGGANLSPRQHLRRLRPAPISFASIVRSVREYRQRFPAKAVTYFANENCHGECDGWAVLMGGGSLADVQGLPTAIAEVLPNMAPNSDVASGAGICCLADANHCLVSVESPRDFVSLQLPVKSTRCTVSWLDRKTGQLSAEELVDGAGLARLRVGTGLLWVSAAEGRNP